jgi:hypothetical protein
MPVRIIFSPEYVSLIGSILIKGTADTGKIQIVTINAHNINPFEYFCAIYHKSALCILGFIDEWK